MILITGAGGQLGRCFQKLAPDYPELKFLFATSSDLDITSRRAVNAFFKKNNITWVLNCAAYTAVDKAESEPARARAVNVTGAANLAHACAETGAGMVHFSTDYVYHNRQNTPFREDDATSPKGVYARTKLAGEKAVQRMLPGAMIVRTSWVYAREGANFVNTMVRLGNERPELRVVFDQIGTPTYAPDMAEAVLHLVQKVEKDELAQEKLEGIWHYSNEGVCSWYDFACAVMEIAGLNCRVLPIESREYPTPALRPPFSVLNKGKIKEAFGLTIPHWRESLKRSLQDDQD
ncbi:MAG: dTDP-4-dehydrorhamnose reductase [Saprospiraceae bacterium]|nr:dTDP-4-dehydrorhamnose reductase [Saprospiraceae bacterium]